MASKQVFTAVQIEQLLRTKHVEDVFVAECKIGPSGTAAPCRRFDAWVMRRSYSPFCCIGYEIKVSRQDFVNDTKLTEYLPYCHQFYLVAPDGVVKPEELPAEAGLIKVTKNGKRLLTAKKAPFRQVTVPDSLFKYVIMSRSTIHAGSMNYTPEMRLEAYRKFLDEKADKHNVGRLASKKIAQYVRDAAYERDEALRRVERVEVAVEAFKAAGIDINTISGFSAERRVREIMAGVPDALLEQLDRVARDTASLAEHLRKKRGAN